VWLLSVWILLKPLYHKSVNCHFYQYEYGQTATLITPTEFSSWIHSPSSVELTVIWCLANLQLNVCVAATEEEREIREKVNVWAFRPEAACHKVRLAVIICRSMCVCVCGVWQRGESYGLCSLTQTNVKSPFTLHQKTCQ